jgi:hypothetical protein
LIKQKGGFIITTVGDFNVNTIMEKAIKGADWNHAKNQEWNVSSARQVAPGQFAALSKNLVIAVILRRGLYDEPILRKLGAPLPNKFIFIPAG